jgi:lipase
MRLHTWTYGSSTGTAVLALHGVRNHGGRFRRLAGDAYPDAWVIAPDLRGHGRSGWEPPWDVPTHVADLLETLDAHGVDMPVEVIGHSFGGLIACALAARAPKRVRSLTLLDPASGLDPAQCADAAAMDVRGEGRSASWGSVAEAREAWSAVRPPEGQWARDEDLEAFLMRDGDGRYRLRFAREAAIVAWSEMARPVRSLGDWRGPVTLVTALREPYVTEALRSRLREECQARLTEVGIDCGHVLMWDAPEETAHVVRGARSGSVG